MRKTLPEINKYRNIITVVAAVFLLATLLFIVQKNRSRNVKAYGNLVVDYGQVVDEEPIFDFDDFKPGDCEERVVTITNASDSPSLVYVRAENVNEIGNLSNALYFSMYDVSLHHTYGVDSPKTVEDFFNESTYPGIPLFTLGGGENINITFHVCFEINSGNEYQNTSTMFDVVFAAKDSSHEIPDDCSWFFCMMRRFWRFIRLMMMRTRCWPFRFHCNESSAMI
jgi:hypothetical protein